MARKKPQLNEQVAMDRDDTRVWEARLVQLHMELRQRLRECRALAAMLREKRGGAKQLANLIEEASWQVERCKRKVEPAADGNGEGGEG